VLCPYLLILFPMTQIPFKHSIKRFKFRTSKTIGKTTTRKWKFKTTKEKINLMLSSNNSKTANRKFCMRRLHHTKVIYLPTNFTLRSLINSTTVCVNDVWNNNSFYLFIFYQSCLIFKNISKMQNKLQFYLYTHIYLYVLS
jgi:hypothetical protein